MKKKFIPFFFRMWKLWRENKSEVKATIEELSQVYIRTKKAISEESPGGKKITLQEAQEINKEAFEAIEKTLKLVGDIDFGD